VPRRPVPAKLALDQIDYARRMIVAGEGRAQIARSLGVDPSTLAAAREALNQARLLRFWSAFRHDRQSADFRLRRGALAT
jgi:hypothetical protein